MMKTRSPLGMFAIDLPSNATYAAVTIRRGIMKASAKAAALLICPDIDINDPVS